MQPLAASGWLQGGTNLKSHQKPRWANPRSRKGRVAGGRHCPARPRTSALGVMRVAPGQRELHLQPESPAGGAQHLNPWLGKPSGKKRKEQLSKKSKINTPLALNTQNTTPNTESPSSPTASYELATHRKGFGPRTARSSPAHKHFEAPQRQSRSGLLFSTFAVRR